MNAEASIVQRALEISAATNPQVMCVASGQWCATYHLSAATMRNIRQNLFFAFAYNALGIPLAAGVLYPWFGILLSPMIASTAMTLSSVSVIANALRLRDVVFK